MLILQFIKNNFMYWNPTQRPKPLMTHFTSQIRLYMAPVRENLFLTMILNDDGEKANKAKKDANYLHCHIANLSYHRRATHFEVPCLSSCFSALAGTYFPVSLFFFQLDFIKYR